MDFFRAYTEVREKNGKITSLFTIVKANIKPGLRFKIAWCSVEASFHNEKIISLTWVIYLFIFILSLSQTVKFDQIVIISYFKIPM